MSERIINTKFFTFNQNNSGGYFIRNEEVGDYLVIEAQNAEEAIEKMYKITEDYSQYCNCCGERWDSYLSDNDGTEKPAIYGDSFFGRYTVIHYYDGKKEIRDSP